jgi:FtsZ-interacting cell division protein ZipA
MQLITILILAIAIFTVAFLVKNVQKAKDEKKGIYADEDKCPYHNEVGYETSAPAAAEVIKAKPTPAKKPATKKPAAKPAAKKPASSQKKK